VGEKSRQAKNGESTRWRGSARAQMSSTCETHDRVQGKGVRSNLAPRDPVRLRTTRKDRFRGYEVSRRGDPSITGGGNTGGSIPQDISLIGRREKEDNGVSGRRLAD